GVAAGADGRVWVADTGNSRLMVYDENLAGARPIGKKGTGAGELDNPIGIAIAPSGKVYVADAGNRRIQVLDPAGNFAASWPVQGWGNGAEPHVEVDADENVWVTDPPGNALLEFGPDGRLRQRITTDLAHQPFSKPTGLAVDRVQGVLYVVNSGSNGVSTIRLLRGVTSR
ncbi:MAG TPA: NHL repeat-containing protein, partial [Thermoanaerobaculia bacterium]